MNWKVLVQGGAGKLAADSVAARASQYWASAVRNWTRISGVSLDSATMQIIQLAKSSPFKTLHQVYDPETKKIVQGELVKKIAPRECVKKYPVKYVHVPDQWLKRIGVAWCGEHREWGGVINHKRNSQTPRSKLIE